MEVKSGPTFPPAPPMAWHTVQASSGRRYTRSPANGSPSFIARAASVLSSAAVICFVSSEIFCESASAATSAFSSRPPSRAARIPTVTIGLGNPAPATPPASNLPAPRPPSNPRQSSSAAFASSVALSTAKISASELLRFITPNARAAAWRVAMGLSAPASFLRPCRAWEPRICTRLSKATPLPSAAMTRSGLTNSARFQAPAS